MNPDGSHPNPTDFLRGPAPPLATTVRPHPRTPPLGTFQGQYYVGHRWAIPGVPGRWEFTTLGLDRDDQSSDSMAQTNLGNQGHWDPDTAYPTAEQVFELRARFVQRLGHVGDTRDIGVIWVAEDERDTALRTTTTAPAHVATAGATGTATGTTQGSPPVPSTSPEHRDSHATESLKDVIKTPEHE